MYVEQVMPKLFGWCQTVFTELHSYLIPATGNGVPPRLILAGGTPFPGKKGGGTAFPLENITGLTHPGWLDVSPRFAC
jgi:hypothetical protein